MDSGPMAPQPLLVLGSPHPNPFNPAVEFLFTLAAPAKVRAAVWDLAGYKVATLADRWFTAGSHRLQWDGRSHGKIAGAGTYLLTVTANGRTVSHKVTLLK